MTRLQRLPVSCPSTLAIWSWSRLVAANSLMTHGQSQLFKLPHLGGGNPLSYFGRVVAAMRHGCELGQAELARRAGCSPSHLSNIEHGRSAPPTEDLARRLGHGLELSLSEAKTFVAEANLARSQWHAQRVRSRQADVDDPATSGSVCARASDGLEASAYAPPPGATSLDGFVSSATLPSPAQALHEAHVGAGGGGRGHGKGVVAQEGAFSIAAQTVRLDIDLPRIGAACLEIDVSTQGSDCCVSMRVVPRTLARERRP